MKSHKTNSDLLQLFVKLLLPALLFLTACNNKTGIKDEGSDYRFKKIQPFIDDSAHYFKAMDSVYSDLPPLKRAYETYNNKRGYFYTYKRDYNKALQYADSSLLLLSKNKNNENYGLWYPQALSLKADDLHALKRYSEAFTYYYLAREAIYASGNKCLYADYSSKLGMVSYRHKHYKNAIEYFKQSAQQETDCKKEGNIDNEYVLFAHYQNNLDNIGLCYSRLEMHDSALYYFDSTLRYINLNKAKAFKYDKSSNKIQDTDFVQSAIGVVYGNMAVDLRAIGKDTVAERLLKQSIIINSKPHRALEDVPYSQSKLADLYIEQLRLAEAQPVLASLKQLIDTLPNAELLQKWYGLKAKYTVAEKDYLSSNDYLTKFIAIKDSLNTIERERLAIDINQTFSFLKSQNELYLFKQGDERKQFYLLLLGIAAIIVAVISILIWRNYQQSKKHIKVLGELNNQLQNKQNHLEKTLAALQSSHDDNSKLMKIVAHDLRNPVSGIAGMSDYLLKENNYTELQRKMLEMMQASSYHSIELIQELLNLNGNVNDFKKEPIDLSGLINYCVETLQVKADKKSQRIKADIAAVKIIGDREKLWRVFANLLGNAVKFSPDNEYIEINVTVKDNNVVIGIKDKGIGIPEDFKEKMFNMDPTIKRKGTSGETSFGFGLAICKQIISNHDGDIWFESEEYKGTVFYVSLPLAA
ncbi:MAG: tetratricopeptide repeat-containing sensor histidine kinase [Chitinophagaceae bacterium]|nr:tetratricopeptide repeat-containing sensor histidine kinase [Chitinophagaceae bacterium]